MVLVVYKIDIKMPVEQIQKKPHIHQNPKKYYTRWVLLRAPRYSIGSQTNLLSLFSYTVPLTDDPLQTLDVMIQKLDAL